MRRRHFLFFSILALLFVMFSGGVFAEGDGTLVFRNKPTDAQLNSLAMYVTPSKDTVNTLIQWSNSCKLNVMDLRYERDFFQEKRKAARTAAYGGLTWKGKTKKVLADAKTILTGDYSGILVTVVDKLLEIKGKIDREQEYALACQEANAHIPKFNRGLDQWADMHRIATLVYNRWLATASGSEIVDHLHDYEYESPLEPEYPSWDCKGNTLLSKSCNATYDTPYKALEDHRVLCGVEKDPNPSVAGCGRPWYTCQEGDGDAHAVKYCDNYIVYYPGGFLLPKQLGKCGAAYRDCPGSQSWSGTHGYEPVYSYNNGNKYASSYRAKTSTAHRGNGGKSIDTFHGPRKYSESISDKIDETQNCSSCIDGSDNCPNASNHGGSSAAASLSPSGGSYTASAGSTHTASVSVPSGYQYVYWYIAGPGIDGLGLLKETDSGYGSSTTADFSWSIPSYTSGDHVITAYTQLSDNSIVQPSYTVTVGSGSSTDTTTTDTSSTTDDDSSTASTSPYSLSISDTDYSYFPGSTVTLNLSGSESYSSVTWEVEEPGYSSTSATYLSYDSGDGYSSEASTSYTFPSNRTGEYLFRAIVYTAGDGSRYEHTYTVSVY